MKQRADAWWPVAAWVVLILVLTGVPLGAWPGLASSGLDKVVHFGMYFGLGWALGRAARISGFSGPLLLLGLLLCGIVFAAVDELLQQWVPRRAPMMADWLADVAGLLTAYGLYLILWRFRWKTDARRA